jgi:hypothetical protein
MRISDLLLESGGIRNEIARDLIALGGLPFYLLVIARATVGSYHDFLSRLVIALITFYILSRFVKDVNQHIARALILVVFTSLHYQHLPFAIFALIVWAMMIYSLTYLKVSGREIVMGITLGAVSAVLGYLLTFLIVPV